MLTETAMRLELERLSSEAVAQIYDALHDMRDGPLRKVAMELLWDRHSTSGGDWPTREEEIGNPNGDPVRDSRGTHTLVASCAGSITHKIWRQLSWSYEDARGTRVFREYQCNCGRRTDGRGDTLLIIRWRQARPSWRVWPTVMRYVETAGKEHPYLQVCRFARHVEDPMHAPNSTGMQCLCGAYLGIHNLDGNVDKLLPVY